MSNSQIGNVRPYFIPEDPPTTGIVDLGHKLSPGALHNIESQIAGLKYNPKVIVLPSNYSPGDFKSFCYMLKDEWQITGDRLLLVVDLKGRQVRALSGNTLNDNGVTGDFLNRELVQHYFLPNAKRGDFEEAIRSALSIVNTKFVKETQTGGGGSAGIAIPAYDYNTYVSPAGTYRVTPPQPATINIVQQPAAAPTKIDFNPIMGGLLFMIVVSVVFVVMFFKSTKNTKLDALRTQYKKLRDSLNRKINVLSEGEKFLPVEYKSFYDTLFAAFTTFMEMDKIPLNTEEYYSKMITSAEDMIVHADNLAKVMFGEDDPKPPTPSKPKATKDYKKSRSYTSESISPTPSPISNYTYIQDNSWSTYSPPAPAPEPKHSPPPSSDSGTSSWGSSSSSKSETHNDDSGTSSWSSSSDSFSSGDSGSSSFDSGSSGGDSGSGGW